MTADFAADAATLCIEQATADDVDAMLQIERLSYPLPWSRASLAEIVQKQGTGCGDYAARLLRARHASGQTGVLGYFVALLGFEEMHLLNLAVHPAYRGQGCAVLLLQELRDQARRRGARMLWLEVRQSNGRAQALYRRFGFADVAVRKNYYPTPEGGREHALVMQLPLLA